MLVNEEMWKDLGFSLRKDFTNPVWQYQKYNKGTSVMFDEKQEHELSEVVKAVVDYEKTIHAESAVKSLQCNLRDLLGIDD